MLSKNTYQWTKNKPDYNDIPDSMECQGIKKEDDVYKLIGIEPYNLFFNYTNIVRK